MIRGRVFLHTQAMLLLDRLQLSVRHPTLGAWVTHLDTTRWLLDSGWDVKAPDQLQRLNWMAQRAGLSLRKKKSIESIDCLKPIFPSETTSS